MGKNITPTGRASYPKLAEVDDNGKYRIDVLLEKTDANKKFVLALNKQLGEAFREEFGDGAKMDKANFCIADGDKQDTEANPEYAGHYKLRFKTGRKPTVVDRAARVADAEIIYGGADVKVLYDWFVWSWKNKKGISLGLRGVQFVGDNDAFGSGGGGSSARADEFEALEPADFGDDGLADGVESADDDDFLN